MKLFIDLPYLAKFVLIAFVFYCVWDFSQRVWVSVETSKPNVANFDASDYAVGSLAMASTVKEWLDEREAKRLAATEAEESSKEPELPLIDGGMNLGNMRVRVRAIYTAPESEVRIALLDIQNIEQRSVEIINAQEGYTVNSYTLETIDVNSVVFRSAESETLTIPVFDY